MYSLAGAIRIPGIALAGALIVAASSCARAPSPLGLHPLADSTQGEIARAVAVAEGLQTQQQARRKGFIRIAPESLTDLNVFQGEHWINDRALRFPAMNLEHPGYLMYYPLGDPPRATLVGSAYAMLTPTGSEAPEGFFGSHDHWHVHLPCFDVPGLGYVLADSEESCRADLNGRPGPLQIMMVHVWTEVPSPDGPFAMFNPALPYVAVGMNPPSAEDFGDPIRSPTLRKLSLALGEAFGAVPRMGVRIAQHRDSLFADRVRPQRDRIRTLLPRLREAQETDDTLAFAHLAAQAIAEWETIRGAYLESAFSPQHRRMLETWFATATTAPRNSMR